MAYIAFLSNNSSVGLSPDRVSGHQGHHLHTISAHSSRSTADVDLISVIINENQWNNHSSCCFAIGNRRLWMLVRISYADEVVVWLMVAFSVIDVDNALHWGATNVPIDCFSPTNPWKSVHKYRLSYSAFKALNYRLSCS